MKILLLDVETAPNTVHVWGLWNQNVGINQIMASGYTMCFAAKWYGEKDVMFDSIYHSTPKIMMKRLHKLLEEADAVVHYNGTKFDIPTVNKEFILFNLKPPAPYKQIDLLKTARSVFRFPSNKLDYVASVLLDDHKVANTGHLLWRQCLDSDIAQEVRRKAWSLMARYCRKDVDLLVPLHAKLTPWLPETINVSVIGSQPLQNACPKCGSTDVHKRGMRYTRTRAYHRYLCMSCGGWFKGSKMLWGPAAS